MKKTLFKGGTVVNVFTDGLEEQNVLVEGDRIIAVGSYDSADEVVDVSGKYICPGFIDGHIHIESSMLLPYQLAKAAVPHGTSAIVADPHEIANVCGTAGIDYMLEASAGLPMDVYFALPSCVPASSFDESGAVLTAEDLEPFYDCNRVVSLGEVMNYPGVISRDSELLKKIFDAEKHGRTVNGHAPLLSGADLDAYVCAGIQDDHECSDIAEAKEKLAKGQTIMIRQGTSARNLEALIDLFDEPYNRSCILVTDDKHPADFACQGHIDSIIRKAVELGKSPVAGIRMASIQAARHYSIPDRGAVAPGYYADFLILDSLEDVLVRDVYHHGKLVCEDGRIIPFIEPVISASLEDAVSASFRLPLLTENSFIVCSEEKYSHVIQIIPGDLLTDDMHIDIDFSKNNGVDIENDILKIAVCERHNNTGHIGIGFIHGIGLKHGAIVSSVSHDSHNLIVIGTNEKDMAAAANRCVEIGGGLIVVSDGSVKAEMPLPIAGLMTTASADEAAQQNEAVRTAVHKLGAPDSIEPFMNMAFVSLTVIPHLKMTTHGLFDVDTQSLI